MMKKLVMCLCLLAAVALECHAYEVRPRRYHVYMFGFATSFTDSVAVITDLQELEAYIMPNGFLADRSLYTLQFNNHLKKAGMNDMTCVVFFSKSKSKLEKKYQKVRRKFREKHGVEIQYRGVDTFHFETEEWIESTVTEAPPKTTEPKESKKKKK